MGENTKIQWADHTFNPWRGCAKVSAGCTNCYAEKQAKRNPTVLGIWGVDGTRPVASESMWRQPLKWNAEARKANERRRVFCASMADVFEEREDLDDARLRLFGLTDVTSAPDLDWLLLTKRPHAIMETIARLLRKIASGGETTRTVKETRAVERTLREWIDGKPPANVWVGTSVEDARVVDRIDHLRAVPAVIHFLSVEPLIGPLDLDNKLGGIEWVIIGGESGPRARVCDHAWIDSIIEDCRASGAVPFVKQLGACVADMPFLVDKKGGDMDEWPPHLRVREIPTVKPC